MHLFLGKEGIFGSEFIFLSCGDFDGNTLKREAAQKEIFIPNYLKRWINIKKAFPLHIFDKCEPKYDFNSTKTIKTCKPIVNGMTDMLDICEIKLQGKHHSGIDDSKNIASCVLACLEKSFIFTQGMVYSYR